MNIITETLDRLTIQDPITFENLSLFPITASHPVEPGYISLDEALAKETVEITEVSAGGSVPELKLINKGDTRILLLDGEELVGAKQNRILNLTILVPPKAEIIIPVTCVEQGRWSYRSSMFRTSGRSMYTKARSRTVESVSLHLACEGSRSSDQHGIWNSISAKSMRMGASLL